EGLGVDLAEFRQAGPVLAEKGATLIPVAVDGAYAGCLAVADPIKPGAAEAVAALRRMGVEPALVTGDRKEAAEAVARALGIIEVRAGLLPEEKARAVA